MTKKNSIAYPVYANPEFVKRYLSSIRDNAWNAYYERPSTMSLLPDLRKKKVLDAGCGPGLVSLELINRGAIVTGIDYSPAMVAAAKELVAELADIKCVDLNDGLEIFNDKSFDLIYCSLTIHYIHDLDFLFSEFYRILTDDGILIFSTDHPENPKFLSNPIELKRAAQVPWNDFGVTVELIERPWSEITDSLKKSKFIIDKVIDAQPSEECQAIYPEDYNNFVSNRYFICLRAIKNIISNP